MTPDLRFPPERRLRKPQEFERCFAQGVRVNGRLFRLHLLQGGTGPRMGLAVSRKVDTSAVVRNRIKRCARDSFRHHADRLPVADYILVARREAASATPEDLRADLASLWRKSAALKPAVVAGTMRDAVDAPVIPRDA
jgi:ribonuclease P protein component